MRGTARPRRGRSDASRPYHHGNLRDALVEAALQVLAETGTESLTLREVARRAGVSHAAPAHHFGDASGLVAAVAARGYRELAAEMKRGATADSNPVVALRAAGLAYVEFAMRRPDLFRMMFHPAVADKSAFPELEEASGTTFDFLLARITVCQHAGLVRPGDPRGLALSAWSTVHGLAVLAASDQLRAKGFREGIRRLGENVTQDLFLGLRAP